MSLAAAALPLHYYHDPAIYAAECQKLFSDAAATLFLGHESFVPNSGDYWVVPHTQTSTVLVNNGQGIRALDNICRHRYALLLQGSGNVSKIVCPVHYWSYKLSGELLKAPGCEVNDNCHLPVQEIVSAAGFLMPTGNRTLQAALEQLKNYTSLSFDELAFLGMERSEVGANWKDYVDTFLDLYHIEAAHPGLTGLVNSNQIDNHLGEGFHIQAVKMRDKPYAIARAGLLPLMRLYHDKLGGLQERYGAIWITLYPNIMIEIYEAYMVVNLVRPLSVDRCEVYKYAFCHQRLQAHTDIISAYHLFLSEVEFEDVNLMTRIAKGRAMLLARGDSYRGPYHPTKQDGEERFHNWLVDKVG